MPYVYLVQPVELVGTNRYKIGMSSLANLTRMQSYKNGTRHLCIFEKANALAVERKLIIAFKQRYRLIGGNEYFEVDDENEMIQLFISIAMDYPLPQSIKIVEPNKLYNEQSIDKSCGGKSLDWIKKFAYES